MTRPTTVDAVLHQLAGGASLRTPMAYERWRALGETKHHEYYEGLCVVNPPTRAHSRAVLAVIDLLRPHCPSTHEVLTGWGWHIPPQQDFEPDVLVSDRSSPDRDVLRRPPPLLVVEVSSPSTRDVDWGAKRRAYGAGGAAWYWIVDVGRSEVVVLENRGGELVEAQRISTTAVAAGPFLVTVDPAALAGASGA